MQGGNRWAIHKHKKLTAIGFKRNPSEPSLYHRLDNSGFVMMDIIVDDFEITGFPPSAIAHAKQQLANIWDMTDLGPLRYFANVEIIAFHPVIGANTLGAGGGCISFQPTQPPKK